jgi:hypothetical protein
MIKLLLSMAMLTGATLAAAAAPLENFGTNHESIEWCDIWLPHANETNLPRVLLIGDSISRDYYPEVEKRLAGKAYVGRLSSSAFISDPLLLDEIKVTLSSMKFDIIHFNNGMHGWQHTEEEYKDAFPAFLTTIHQCAPQAKLIWASTTPLKISPVVPPQNSNESTGTRITERNTIALKFIAAERIPVDDLFSLMNGHPEFHRDNIHFNPQGVALQAAHVAAQIERVLRGH